MMWFLKKAGTYVYLVDNDRLNIQTFLDCPNSVSCQQYFLQSMRTIVADAKAQLSSRQKAVGVDDIDRLVRKKLTGMGLDFSNIANMQSAEIIIGNLSSELVETVTQMDCSKKVTDLRRKAEKKNPPDPDKEKAVAELAAIYAVAIESKIVVSALETMHEYVVDALPAKKTEASHQAATM